MKEKVLYFGHGGEGENEGFKRKSYDWSYEKCKWNFRKSFGSIEMKIIAIAVVLQKKRNSISN